MVIPQPPSSRSGVAISRRVIFPDFIQSRGHVCGHEYDIIPRLNQLVCGEQQHTAAGHDAHAQADVAGEYPADGFLRMGLGGAEARQYIHAKYQESDSMGLPRSGSALCAVDLFGDYREQLISGILRLNGI